LEEPASQIALGSLPAGFIDTTAIINPDEYLFLELKALQQGWALILDLEVLNDMKIDVMLMDAANYDKYIVNRPMESTFRYYADASAVSVAELNYTFAIPQDGTYYLVLDNTHTPKGGAKPVGSVLVKVRVVIDPYPPEYELPGTTGETIEGLIPGTREGWISALYIIALVIVISACFTVIMVARKRRRQDVKGKK
jgi:hypothetical protein